MKNKPVYDFVKRIMDFICSFLAIIILLIPMIIIGVAIRVDSNGPIIFKQIRVGKNRKVFKIYKFRSMYIDTDPDMPTHKLDNATLHITKVGSFIRKTSLDELPQLFNIFIGQMSFVGPRPALWNQDDLIAEREKYHANDIIPGLTGIAQISGRDELDIQKKARLDGVYVEKRTFLFDVEILFKTVASVLHHDGIVEGEATIEEGENQQ